MTVYKDKEIDKNIHSNKVDEKIGLDELERRFMSDTDWQQSLLPLLSDKDRPKIVQYIREFFQILKARGFEKREERLQKSLL